MSPCFLLGRLAIFDVCGQSRGLEARWLARKEPPASSCDFDGGGGVNVERCNVDDNEGIVECLPLHVAR